MTQRDKQLWADAKLYAEHLVEALNENRIEHAQLFLRSLARIGEELERGDGK